jgi:hypothetical protein
VAWSGGPCGRPPRLPNKEKVATDMAPMQFEIGDRLRLRKPHPCGNYDWVVVRLGGDIGLCCEKCGRRVLLPRSEVERRTKQILPRLPKTDVDQDAEP